MDCWPVLFNNTGNPENTKMLSPYPRKTNTFTKVVTLHSDALLLGVIYLRGNPRKHENPGDMFGENQHMCKNHRSGSRFPVARRYLGGQKPAISGVCKSCAQNSHFPKMWSFHVFTVPNPLFFHIFPIFWVHPVYNRFDTVKTRNDSRAKIPEISVLLCPKMCTLCALLFTVPNLMCAHRGWQVCTFCATDVLR